MVFCHGDDRGRIMPIGQAGKQIDATKR